jgi:hypothetical protein
MFESSFLLRVAKPALDGTIPLQPDYNDCWRVGLRARAAHASLTSLCCFSEHTEEFQKARMKQLGRKYNLPQNTRALKTPLSPATWNF